MIIAVMVHREANKRLIALGLSHDNLNKLLAGQAIHRDLQPDFGIPLEVIVHVKPTEDEILAELREHGFLPPDSPEARAEDALLEAGRTAFEEFLRSQQEPQKEGEGRTD